MKSLYRAGNSPIHRLPVWLKLLLLGFSVWAINAFGKGLVQALVVAGIVVLLYLMAGLSVKEIAIQFWRLKWFLLLILLPQLYFAGIGNGSFNAVVVIATILLASLISLTTKTSEIVSLIQRITKSESIALLFGLSINAVPLVTGLANQVMETTRARGVRANPVRQLVTLFVVALRNADEFGEALAARGVEV